MKRNKKELKSTVNSSVYKKLRINSVAGCCLSCKRRTCHIFKNWKKYKKQRWE